MAKERDSRPDALGSKIVECPRCRRTGKHLLTEKAEPKGSRSGQRAFQVVCANCGLTTPLDGAPGIQSGVSPRTVPDPRVKRAGEDRGTSLIVVAGVVASILLVGLIGLGFATGGLDPFPGSQRAAAEPTESAIPRATAAPQSPRPTQATRPSPTPEPTVAPSPSPVATAAPSPTLVISPLDRLRSLVPPQNRASPCAELLGSLPTGSLAGLRCEQEGETTTTIDYYLFESEPAVRMAFAQAREAVNIRTPGPGCFEGGTREFDGYRYADRDQPSGDPVDGEVTCYRRQGRPHVVWSREQELVLARAFRNGGRAQEMMAWWQEGEPGPCDGPC